MTKQRADSLIFQYQNKIFGFAMEKMRNISQAQELASDIICEVYISFLHADEIVNVDGYVYRISCNVYARYIHRISTERDYADITELSLPYHEKGYERLEHLETLNKLRSEIGFLSKRQRTILYLYYYDDMSVAEIAKQLAISPGTVKWHLADARTTLKEELVMEHYDDKLSVNPIQFIGMGHNGHAGERGDTQDMFQTQLKQNIAYSCYYTPRTVEEIARTLNVPIVYIADEIRILEDYGYLDRIDKTANPRFRTNMVIYDNRVDQKWKEELYHTAAKKLCNEFYPKLFADFESSADHWGFVCADQDLNFMKYNLIMLCTCYMCEGLKKEIQESQGEDDDWWEKYAVERPDGGKFIAHAVVTDDCHRKPDSSETACSYPGYAVCGEMTRCAGNHQLHSLQLDCRYSSRNGGWRDNLNQDWESVYEFISHDFNKDALEPEAYKRLCDKGYLVNDKLYPMSIITDAADKWTFLRDLILTHAPISEEWKTYSNELDDQIYAHEKNEFPEHILPIIRQFSRCSLASPTLVPMLVEEMLSCGMLQPLTDVQKKSVFTIIAYTR